MATKNNSVNEQTSEVDNLYLEQYAFTTSAALVGSLNKRVFVLLRDGRNLFGILRSFDQFANLVVQDTVERIYLVAKKQYGELVQDNFLIRGENVVMLGECDFGAEDGDLEQWEKIDYLIAYTEMKQLQKQQIKEGKANTEQLLAHGYTGDFLATDLY